MRVGFSPAVRQRFPSFHSFRTAVYFRFRLQRLNFLCIVFCLCVYSFFSFSVFYFFCWKTHTKFDEKFPSSLVLRGGAASWMEMNQLIAAFLCIPDTHTYIHTPQICIRICVYNVYAEYIVGFNLRRFTCKLMGRPNLRTCPIIGVLFESAAAPATSCYRLRERHKKKN